MRSKGQNSTFSEHGHVAYQIKCSQECSNIVANILPADPKSLPSSPDPGGGVKIQRRVAYQIKGNLKCSNMIANTLAADPPPCGWGQKVKIQLFQSMVMLHIK